MTLGLGSSNTATPEGVNTLHIVPTMPISTDKARNVDDEVQYMYMYIYSSRVSRLCIRLKIWQDACQMWRF